MTVFIAHKKTVRRNGKVCVYCVQVNFHLIKFTTRNFFLSSTFRYYYERPFFYSELKPSATGYITTIHKFCSILQK